MIPAQWDNHTAPCWCEHYQDEHDGRYDECGEYECPCQGYEPDETYTEHNNHEPENDGTDQ